ncbi:MAG TPA: VOC family protein, partial [Thermoplasmata archaeon]|nr:VOC family protein [Thermoplasmata archaeon]
MRRATRQPKVGVKGITPFLWFDDQAEAAAKFYVSIFRDSRITEVGRAPGSSSRKRGPVMTVSFELAGQPVLALNGGPGFPHSPAFSFFVSCSNQRQVDTLW